MIKVNNFNDLEKKILERIYEIDLSIEQHKEMEFYEKIPYLEYKRKKQIEFYIDTLLKYDTGGCQKATDIIALTSKVITDRESAYALR